MKEKVTWTLLKIKPYSTRYTVRIGKDKLPTGKDMSLQNPACDYF